MTENSSTAKASVAVVGGGVAGIVAAHLLQKTHRVSLFEAGKYLGGHTHTIRIDHGPDAGLAVDTGFIVFNEATYPHFIGFLEELGVPSRATEMSFGFHCVESGFVYAGNDLNGLFCQRSNALSPRFYRFLFEIARFCRRGKIDVESQEDLGTLADYVRRHKYHPFMVENYLKPMAAAIWSTPTAEVTAFPARSFLSFFRNHGLLDLWNRPAWRTVAGGSNSYVKAFTSRFNGSLHLDTEVQRITRGENQVQLHFSDGRQQTFDHLVLATHADISLRLLADPTAAESRLLGPWQYEENHTVLHTDQSVLPPMQRAWSCWNFRREGTSDTSRPAYVTYAMNLLQGLSTKEQYLVTLNRPTAYDESKVIARIIYHHPCYTETSMATQAELVTLNGVGNTWFCGSYFGYGFHEDAVRSSYQMAAQLTGREK